MENKIKPRGFLSRLLTVFYPDRCPCCERVIYPERIFCDECIKEYNSITYKTYAKGGYPCVSPVPYDGVFAKAILNFKFNNKRHHAYRLAYVIAQAVTKEYDCNTFDMITYVPLHKRNQSQRGFNQSELIAKKLSDILKIPLVSTLRKTRFNQPQHKLKASKRGENVRGAYRIIDKNLVKDKRILIIDDIITTGHTLGECARILDMHAPASVSCATFAITVVKTT